MLIQGCLAVSSERDGNRALNVPGPLTAAYWNPEFKAGGKVYILFLYSFCYLLSSFIFFYLFLFLSIFIDFLILYLDL